MVEPHQSVSFLQDLRLLGRAPDQNRYIERLDDRVQDGGCQIAAQADTKNLPFEQSHGVSEKTAVEQHIGCLCVKRSKVAVLMVTDDVIDIRGDDISVASAAERRDELQSFFEIVVVDI
jgi:hypothetical protein